jgi:hypothetical protein
MQLVFILYVLACIIVISGTFYTNRQGGKQLTSIVTPVLFLAIAVFFGLRWFNTSGDATITTNLSPVWPPPNFINVCPDFLSLNSSNDGDGNITYTCIDVLGISAANSDPFILGVSSNNPATIPDNWTNLNDLCKNCKNMNYTWEGVCNNGTPIIEAGTLPKPV